MTLNQPDNNKMADMVNARQSCLVDWSVLDSLKVLQKPGKPDLCRNLMTLYISSLEQLVENAKAAVKAADGDALMKAAHSMKSSSLVIGATVFGETCAELEQIGKHNNFESAPALMSRAESEFTATCSAFRKALERNS